MRTSKYRGMTLLALAVLSSLLAGVACSGTGRQGAKAKSRQTLPPGAIGQAPCDTPPKSLSGYGPGDLVAAKEVEIESNLTGARAWRVLYVSTGVDETALVPVCGLVVAPDSAAKLADADAGGRGKVVTWSHGTIGITPECQPSNHPDNLWGTTPRGINILSYGATTSFDKHTGKPADGALQHMVDSGWVVAATDYWQGLGKDALQAYVVGPIAGRNVLDSGRAATALVQSEYGKSTGTTGYDLLTWGHSQGGHASLWAGQLARDYLAATTPLRAEPVLPLRLVGVVALAPASNFVAAVGSPPSEFGQHLGDREMHQVFDAQLFDVTVEKLAIGAALFSYVTGGWTDLSDQPLASGARFPAYPPESPNLDSAALVTKEGLATATRVQDLCMDVGKEAMKLQKLVTPYLEPSRHQFFVEPVWGKADAKGDFVGQLDATCAAPPNDGLSAWCAWMRWNGPGPNGTSPMAKVPTFEDGSLVPMFIAQGEADNIIHCMYDGKGVAPPADCLSRQLFDQLSAVYCPAGNAAGHLDLRLWRLHEPDSPADHMSIPGQAESNAELAFVGSPVEEFMSQAMKGPGSSPPGCVARVMNE